jgi:hypothetical protein
MKDKVIEIDADLLAKFEALPDCHAGAQRKVPTPEQVEILRRYWKVKRQQDVCDLIGARENTCRKWYQDYVEKEG